MPATSSNPSRNSSLKLSLLLVGSLALSTAAILWFMSRAMRNETVAVQQQLTTLYTNQIGTAQQRIALFWSEWERKIDSTQSLAPSVRFEKLVRSNLLTSALVFQADGLLGYPSDQVSFAPNSPTDPSGWTEARRLEYQEKDYLAAAKAYEAIATEVTNVTQQARIRIAQANSLVKGGVRAEAITMLTALTQNAALSNETSSPGALMIPNLQLRLLKLIDNPEDSIYQQTRRALIDRLNNYSPGPLLAAQRRFLMNQLLVLNDSHSDTNGSVTADTLFPTYSAEHLVARYQESNHEPASPVVSSINEEATTLHLASSDASLIALFELDDLYELITREIQPSLNLANATIDLLQPEQLPMQSNSIPILPASDKLPGWRLAVRFPEADPIQTNIRRQRSFYLLTGGFVIGSLALVGFLVARQLHAQMRLARMKNELVSTVSHELKTPLASMKALVETLLAGRVRNEGQQREYLELIASENNRLSHLIENFLTFSRLERGRQRFRMRTHEPADIIEKATTALRERLHEPTCQFVEEIEAGLPSIQVDDDALCTVVVNLLDNALKYTDAEKKISLRAHHDNGSVVFTVSDNGIGFESKDQKRIFDRFHQLDQGLTRERGGCGLGLSIVLSIVQAHRGKIKVESTPGQGTIFAVSIPASQTRPNHE